MRAWGSKKKFEEEDTGTFSSSGKPNRSSLKKHKDNNFYNSLKLIYRT